jgi:hypothetical protein
LLGQALEGWKIGRRVDQPDHAFLFEFLAKGEGEWFGHGGQLKVALGSLQTLRNISDTRVSIATELGISAKLLNPCQHLDT